MNGAGRKRRGRGIRGTGLAVALVVLPAAAPAQLDEALVGEHVVTLRVELGG